RSAGRSLRTEMNDTSTVAIAQGSGTSRGERRRALSRSSTTTRGSARRRSWSCARPTSTAYTRAAPRSRRVSVNPPVDAPTSAAPRPRGELPNASSAPASLPAPRPTCAGPPRPSTRAPARTAAPGLVAGTPSTRTRPAITSACAFSRDGAREWSTSQTSSRGRPRRGVRRPGVPASCAALDDQGGQRVEQCRALAERRDRLARLGAQGRGDPTRALQAVQPPVGRLPGRGVLARGLAELLRALRGVEHVVDDLEREADGRAVAGQPREVRARGPAQHAAAAHARGEQRARLGPVQALQRVRADVAIALRLQVRDLSADQARCTRGLAEDGGGLDASPRVLRGDARGQLQQEMER